VGVVNGEGEKGGWLEILEGRFSMVRYFNRRWSEIYSIAVSFVVYVIGLWLIVRAKNIR